MNKPLKNSEWKSNRASSYYWITSLWKPEADLSSDSTLNLHRSSWCTAVPVGGHHSLLECQFHCDYPHHRHMRAILPPRSQKTWLGHLSNLLTLQGRWHPPEDIQDPDNPRSEGLRKASKPSEEKRSQEVNESWSLSTCLCLFLTLRTFLYAQCSLSFLVVCSHRNTVSSVPRADRIPSQKHIRAQD